LTKKSACGLLNVDRQVFISLHHTRQDPSPQFIQRFFSDTVNMPAWALIIGFWFSLDNLQGGLNHETI